MTITALIFASVLQQAPDKVVYRDTKLGLQFEHPKTWKVRRDRYSAVFEIPVGTAQIATVQLFSAKYKGNVDEWQLIQSEINRSMKRTVERQWQEDLLGVPLLLTKISYTDAGRPQMAIIGLLYSSFEEKMHFRLTSGAEVGEAAETNWRDALLTLRTVTGELPTIENPNLPSVKPEPEKSTTVLKPNQGEVKPERGPVVAEQVSGSNTFKVSLANGWTLEGSKLSNSGLKGQLELTTALGLPEDAGMKLLESAKGALGEFENVLLREDPKPEAVKSGAVIGRVFRVGTAKGVSLVRGSVVGYCEGVYWLASYRAGDAKDYRHDKPILDELFRLLYAEKA